jgi:hypothetical protein
MFCGCATPQRPVDTSRTFDMPYDEVWSAVGSFFAEKGMHVRTADKKAGLIVIDGSQIPFTADKDDYDKAIKSDYCSCPKPLRTTAQRELMGDFKVHVKNTVQSPTVEIKAVYKTSEWVGPKFAGWARCESSGYLEEALLIHIGKANTGKRR